MAITLAVFVAAQVAMPLLVRPNLIAPVQSTFEITGSSIDQFVFSADGLVVRGTPRDGGGAWMLSSHIVDASGNEVDSAHRAKAPHVGALVVRRQRPVLSRAQRLASGSRAQRRAVD
jgi:hypothetical protein